MNFRRHRRSVTLLVLGMWLFALVAGIANACLPEPDSHTAPMAGMAMGPGQNGDEGQSPCQQFCSDDTPLLSKLQLVQDQPTGQPLLIASVVTAIAPVAASPTPLLYRAHPPPDVPILLRSLRLAL